MSAPLLLSSFTPSTMAPEVLEAIFVKREPLAGRIVDSLVAAVRDGDVEHHLAVGPRGMGKTHLLTIVVNRLRARDLGDALAVAWLREDEWGVTNLGELYEQMLIQLAQDPTAESALRTSAAVAAQELLSVDPDVLADTAEGHLTELLASRRLVVVVENLDQIFSSIGEEDQHQLRAYLQTHRNLVLLASSPSLSPSIATREGLFFGFFAIHHLDELTVDEARDLLLRIASLRDDDEGHDLQRYLRTEEATNRLKVVARIAGGHPRLWVLMSECITTERLDEIVSLLHALLDDLTPYYQSQMTSLSGQQRKVVTVLARTDGALVVKDVAARARLAHNATAKHIGDLVKLGFVRPAMLPDGLEMSDKRAKAYELREPLLRHCLEVKESRGEPLRLIVDFLRAWFDPSKLHSLSETDGVIAAYARAATAGQTEIDSFVREAVGLVLSERADDALRRCEQVSLADEHRVIVDAVRGLALLALDRFADAIDVLSRSLDELESESDLLAPIQLALATALLRSDRLDEAAAAFARLVELDTDEERGHVGLIQTHARRRDTAAGMAAATAATSALPDNAEVARAALLMELQASGELPSRPAFRRAVSMEDMSQRERLLFGREYICTVVDHLPVGSWQDAVSIAYDAGDDGDDWRTSILSVMLGWFVGIEPPAPSQVQVAWLRTVQGVTEHWPDAQAAHVWAAAIADFLEQGDAVHLLPLPESLRDGFAALRRP